MHLTVEQLHKLGISSEEIKNNLATGVWQSTRLQLIPNRKPQEVVPLAALPPEIQAKWLQSIIPAENGQTQPTLFQTQGQEADNQDKKLVRALLRFPQEERLEWINEAIRLARIIELYDAIKPRRFKDPDTGKYKFVDDVLKLCEEAACNNQMIISREPHRKRPPSPYTLDGLLLKYRVEGLVAFLRSAPTFSCNRPDMRRAGISKEAFDWVSANWRRFSSAHFLYQTLDEISKKKNWSIPSQSWFYRQWEAMPAIVKAFRLGGMKAYMDKHAPYVPRDVSGLEALQVVCGDHSERDVSVLLPDKTLARPWLSLWYDVRTGLCWGWHLSLAPSSHTAGLAYADGVMNFGAQPFSRPEENFYSYIYTDNGRDYKSHNWDGKVVAVHRKAAYPDGGFEFLLIEHKVGIINDFEIKHLVARGHNPREKPVERIFKIISEWEQNTFKEYCGRNAKDRPDAWFKLYAEHQLFIQGKRDRSPFITFEEYREKLAEFFLRYNSSAHKRLTLGGETIVPLEEHRRLYTTQYEISKEALALLLMKAAKRVIYKNGVQCFRKNWFYYHEAMAEFKGLQVEIRYVDDDYSRVWVVLPNSEICEAALITPSPIVNPNRRTLKMIAEALAHERRVIREFNFIAQSQIRGETTDDRAVKKIEGEMPQEHIKERLNGKRALVHKLTRMDRKKLLKSVDSHQVNASDVSSIRVTDSILAANNEVQVNEFEEED